jgi:cell shape-determining protein MreC
MRLVGLAAVIFFISIAALWRAPLSGLLWSVFAPVMQTRFVGDASASSTAALADRDALYRENVELKARLGRTVSVRRILAGVLLRPPATPYDTLVIDAGSAEGVAAGDLVSAGGMTVIGSVSEVYAHSSRALLYSAPGASYDATLRFAEGGSIPVLVEGQGGGSLEARVPAGTAVTVGDIATLPGLGGGLTAEVAALDRGESESFITVYLRVPVDLFMLHFVEVWKTHE